MTIVFLNPTGELGGAERSLLDLVAGLRLAQPGWALHVVVGGHGPLADRVRALGVTVVTLPFPPSFARFGEAASSRSGRFRRLQLLLGVLAVPIPVAAYARALRARLAAIDPDVVHTNGLKMHVLGALARPRRAALVWHLHDYVSRRPLSSRLLRRLARRCDAVAANSHSVADDARTVCGGTVRVETVHNGVDLERFSPEGERLDLDRLAGMSPAPRGTVRVGLVATFARWKGHEVFLRAMARLPADLPVRGYVIGGAVYETAGSQHSRPQLERLARELGLGDRVGFTGFVDDVASAMRALDVVVHASTEPEPFGLVIVEAMACGRPVIVSLAGGARELVEDGVTAVGHAPGDVSGLSRNIARLVSDDALRRRLGGAARRSAGSFAAPRQADRFTHLYRVLAPLAGRDTHARVRSCEVREAAGGESGRGEDHAAAPRAQAGP